MPDLSRQARPAASYGAWLQTTTADARRSADLIGRAVNIGKARGPADWADRRAARLRAELTARHGEDGAFPPPHTLARLELDLPGRKSEYLRAVADAALDGVLDGTALRVVDPGQAIQRVRQVKGLGPFAAELVVLRGANAPDALPRHERRLDAEVAEQYGAGRSLAEVSQAWRPYRTWAAVHLRALREQRTGEIASH